MRERGGGGREGGEEAAFLPPGAHYGLNLNEVYSWLPATPLIGYKPMNGIGLCIAGSCVRAWCVA